MKSDDENNPLLEDDNYSGKIYWINYPSDIELVLEELRDQLDEKIFYDDITGQIDRGTTFIPEIFIKDGEVVTSSSISNATIVQGEFGECLIADITLDDINRVKYRNEEVLVLGTTQAKILVLEHGGFHYLVVLARREVAESVATVLKQKYDELGSALNETEIRSGALDEIQEAIDARLKDTTITDYPEKELDSLHMRGDGLQEHDEFNRQRDRGKLKTYMLQTEELTPDEPKTIGLSRDGLVRIYSNGTIATYIKLLYDYILPRIHRVADTSPNLTAYQETEDSIFREIDPTEVD